MLSAVVVQRRCDSAHQGRLPGGGDIDGWGRITRAAHKQGVGIPERGKKRGKAAGQPPSIVGTRGWAPSTCPGGAMGNWGERRGGACRGAKLDTPKYLFGVHIISS